MLVGRAKEVGVHLGKQTKKEGIEGGGMKELLLTCVKKKQDGGELFFSMFVLVGLEFALYTKPSYNL